MSDSKEEERWSEDEFGVICWRSRIVGERHVAKGHDPFEQMVESLSRTPNVPDGVVTSAVAVHDDLEVARSIAVSIFGRHWRDHVMDVFDRMRHRRGAP